MVFVENLGDYPVYSILSALISQIGLRLDDILIFIDLSPYSVNEFIEKLFQEYKICRRIIITDEQVGWKQRDIIKTYFSALDIIFCKKGDEVQGFRSIKKENIDVLKSLITQIALELVDEGISCTINLPEWCFCLDDYPVEYRFSLCPEGVEINERITVPLEYEKLLGGVYRLFLEQETV